MLTKKASHRNPHPKEKLFLARPILTIPRPIKNHFLTIPKRLSQAYIQLISAEWSHFIPFIALVGELRLAHQQLPPGERLQLRPVAAVGKLQPPRQNPHPSKSAELIPAGKLLRHLRLGNDQPFPNPRIILRRQIIFTLVSNASSQ